MKRSIAKTVMALALSVSLTGCSTIGSVNGVPLDEAARGKDDYCYENFAICLIGGLAIAGAVVAVIASSEGDTP